VTRALILKELREHAWVMGALLLIQAATITILLLGGKDEGSTFALLRNFTWSAGIIGVLVVNNRLVVREYVSRTQLFLETLPVTRLRVLGVKFLLGLVLGVVPALLALGVCAWVASGREQIGVRYLAILAARVGTFLFCVHAMAFVAALLGRYRYVFWGALLCGFITLDQTTSITSATIPLMRLMDDQMPFERHHFPWKDLLLTGGFGAIAAAVAFALGLSAEGGMAANLARKMSHREKVFFGGLALAFFVAQQTIKEQKPRPLFELASAARAKEGSTLVGVATGKEDETTRAEALSIGAAVAADLEALRVWLDMSEMPPVFLVPDSSLDPDIFIRASLSDTDGVVIKAALADPALDRRSFRAFVLDEVLSWYSHGRSHRETMRWFSGGLSQWWVRRAEPDERLALRAAAAAPKGLTVAEVRDWLLTRERLGDCLGEAVEHQLVALIAEREGAAGLQSLARQALGARPHDDVRATLTRRSAEELLARRGTLKLEGLVGAFNQRLTEDRARLAEPLGKIPKLTASIDARAVGNGGVEVFHRVQTVPPSPAPVEYTLRYSALNPWAGPTRRAWLPRFDTTGNGVLPSIFPRGELLFWAFEIAEPVLGCNIRFASEREELW
jgi:hypothetical protein